MNPLVKCYITHTGH